MLDTVPFGFNAAAVDTAPINGELNRLVIAPGATETRPDVAFTVDFVRPDPTPEVVFVVPPYGSRLYERSTQALFEIEPEEQYVRVPPNGDARYPAPNSLVLIAVEASTAIFTVSRRRA